MEALLNRNLDKGLNTYVAMFWLLFSILNNSNRRINKYDQKIVLEALHNCIAHQDYSRNARIIVIEQLDKLILENTGTFYEGKPEDYIAGHKTPQSYRNPWLALKKRWIRNFSKAPCRC